MTEIPEHLRKRAEEARRKAEEGGLDHVLDRAKRLREESGGGYLNIFRGVLMKHERGLVMIESLHI